MFLDVLEELKILFFSEKIIDLLNTGYVDFQEPIQVGIRIHQSWVFIDSIVDLTEKVNNMLIYQRVISNSFFVLDLNIH